MPYSTNSVNLGLYRGMLWYNKQQKIRLREAKSENMGEVYWHLNKVNKDARIRIKGHRPCIIWLTGLPSAGKSTIANEVEYMLNQKGVHTYILDGDNIRCGLNQDLGFSPSDRQENIRRIGEVAKLFVDAGLIVITAFISPYRKDRDRVRSLVKEGEFIEVFVRCPLAVCEERDVKGLYKKARSGEVKEFTGISAPYEPPLNPEIVLDTDKEDVVSCSKKIIEYLREREFID